MRRVIAIDGGVATGKSAVAKRVAATLKLLYIDTGAIYRCIALLCLRKEINLDEDIEKIVNIAANMQLVFQLEKDFLKVMLNGEDVSAAIRTPKISDASCRVAKHEAVRRVVMKLQRSFAENSDIVIEGRDIGTIVFPNADVKIFLTATLEERARRRLEDYNVIGENIPIEELAKAIQDRDYKDTTRSYAPLKKAENAIEINTTGLKMEEVVEKIVKIAKKQMKI